MPLYVIERDMPGVGDMTDEQARQATLDSLEVIDDLGEGIQWVQSYVVEDKIYCIYFAAEESLIHEHAEKLGIPASRVSAVRRMMEPACAVAAPGAA